MIHWLSATVSPCTSSRSRRCIVVTTCGSLSPRRNESEKPGSGAALPLHPDGEQNHPPLHREGGADHGQLPLRRGRDHVRAHREGLGLRHTDAGVNLSLTPPPPPTRPDSLSRLVLQCHSEKDRQTGLPEPRSSLGEECDPEDPGQVSAGQSRPGARKRFSRAMRPAAFGAQSNPLLLLSSAAEDAEPAGRDVFHGSGPSQRTYEKCQEVFIVPSTF